MFPMLPDPPPPPALKSIHPPLSELHHCRASRLGKRARLYPGFVRGTIIHSKIVMAPLTMSERPDDPRWCTCALQQARAAAASTCMSPTSTVYVYSTVWSGMQGMQSGVIPQTMYRYHALVVVEVEGGESGLQRLVLLLCVGAGSVFDLDEDLPSISRDCSSLPGTLWGFDERRLLVGTFVFVCVRGLGRVSLVFVSTIKDISSLSGRTAMLQISSTQCPNLKHAQWHAAHKVK